tara:strand:- start:73 stop:1224 length:1152 start_codon:yes stop_codon:yes gene_type:complete
MANIPIWNGSSTFTPGETPFGFYDNDLQFQVDIDKFAVFASRRLGYPIVEIELQDLNFYAAFEEAITTYGNEIYAYQVAENLLTLQGAPTNTAPGNNELVQGSLSNVILLSNQYGTEAGVGGTVSWHTGSLTLTPGVQNYDMKSWATSQNIQGGIEIKRIFYENTPAITRYFDPYAGAGAGMMSLMDSMGFGGYSPAMNFMLMPLSYDLQKFQMIEFNDQIRKSQYSFELVNNMLRLFPIPNGGVDTLRFEYILLSDRNQPYVERNGQSIITNASNVPYTNPTYTTINSIGRQWVFEYGLAIVKEILGYVRGKYSTIPIPGSEVTLNQGDLISAATTEKQALIERLRAYLDTTSRKVLLENKSLEAEYQNKTIAQVPMTIFIG